MEEKELRVVVQEALGIHFDYEQGSYRESTLADNIRYHSAYIKGWFKAARIEATEDQIKNEVEEYVKQRLLMDIEKCMDDSDDPTEFRNWVIIRNRY